MIRMESVRIEKFRGIRELVLDMKGENFGICGPNGTGKSGVVDAVEFVLTGSVSRLRGRGTAEISVKSHAPHVKEKDSPERSRVVLKAHVPSLGKSIEISRSVGSPSDCEVSPDDAETRALTDEMRSRPEFVLSRREIIRYILVEAGRRARDVQELMRFEEIEETRAALTTVANAERKEKNNREQEKNGSRTKLLQLLELEEPDTASSSNVLLPPTDPPSHISLPVFPPSHAPPCSRPDTREQPQDASRGDCDTSPSATATVGSLDVAHHKKSVKLEYGGEPPGKSEEPFSTRPVSLPPGRKEPARELGVHRAE